MEQLDSTNKKCNAPATLLEILCAEKASGISGGIYHKVQIELTYNSNHIEGSRLTHDQTRYIFETNTIGMENGTPSLSGLVAAISFSLENCITHYPLCSKMLFARKPFTPDMRPACSQLSW